MIVLCTSGLNNGRVYGLRDAGSVLGICNVEQDGLEHVFDLTDGSISLADDDSTTHHVTIVFNVDRYKCPFPLSPVSFIIIIIVVFL